MAVRSILAIDEGTTNSKAVLVSTRGEVLSRGACSVETRHPKPGWVEQDASQIWSSTVSAIAACLKSAPASEVSAVGISNQRESVLAWSRTTGKPLGPVITWQCRRTAPACDALRNAGHEDVIISKTGLPLDPLFSASKARWLLDNHCQCEAGADICIGTVDSWLVWNFTGGAIHATDASNAARTQLYNIKTGEWDAELCDLFGIDPAWLPVVLDSSCAFGETRHVDGLPDGIPIASAIGDSHGALFGHGAFRPGDGKVTLGTGSSIMTATPEFIVPPKGITTTIAWQLKGTPTYAFEGNILVSASVLPWTAELLGLGSVDALMELARSVDDTLGVNLVPAHVGLGSPHWNAEARGLIDGLTFGAGPAHLAHAAVQSMALQVCDVFDIIKVKCPTEIGVLSVDGGPSRNAFIMQKVADFLDHPVTTRQSTEASAIGAAYLAGLEVGFWSGLDEIAELDRCGTTLEPSLDEKTRRAVRSSWCKAVVRSIHAA
ncbi:MAG: FGGY-family carbohydrate kinase [Paracoccaceae bacterium]|nr:FGGY-family carbohydrate kinase [Paracoccaceae bacterium]